MHLLILGRTESSDSWDDIRIFTYSICMSTLCRRVCAVHEWWATTKSIFLLTWCFVLQQTKQVLKVCIHYVVCLAAGPYPLPKRAIQIMQSSASSLSYSTFSFFKVNQQLLTYSSSTSLSSSPFFNNVFYKAIPTQNLSFLFFVLCRTFMSFLSLCNTSSFFKMSV